MKININTQELRDAIAIVYPALAARIESSYTRAYEFIHVLIGNNIMTLTCFNLVMQIETTIPVSTESSYMGEMLVPGKMLSEIVKKLPADEASFEQEKNAVKITSGAMSMTLQTINPEEFVGLSSPETDVKISLPQGTFKRMIKQTAPFALKDDTRPVLKGSFIKYYDDTLEMVALDNLKFAKRIENVVNLNDLQCNAEILVSASLLESAASILHDSSDEVVLLFSKQNLIIKTDKVTIIIRRMEGNYISYDSIIPKDCDTKAIVNRKDFYSIIDRAYLVAQDDKRSIVKFSYTDKYLYVSVNSEIGSFSDEMPILLSGEPISIQFNARYLIDIVKVIDDEEMCFEFTKRLGPCAIKPVKGNSFFYLTVPVDR
ncbi:MAG: DNA polymerase III subunit beta [Clostridiales bacterium]|nr:DNA polymerase III subunit beta [Clostridiales bacterium]